MKKIFTLAALGLFSATAFTASAQTLDGQVLPAEGYIEIGRYTSTVRGFGDHGLVAFYAKTTADKVYLALTGALESNGNAFQIYVNIPGKTGVPSGTALPVGATGTSFEQNKAIMDMEVDYAFGVKGGATNSASNIIDYTRLTGSGANRTATDQVTGDLPVTGAAVTVPAATTGGLNKTRMAFRNVFFLVGPVAATPLHNGTQGWEIELDKADLGITNGATLQLFAAQNGGNGGFFSSDVIPAVTGNTAPQTAPIGTNEQGNFGTDPNFVTLPGTQFITYAATVTSTRSKVASELGFTVYPNPARGVAQVEYNVLSGKQAVSLNVYNGIGQLVRSLTSEQQSAGLHSYALDNLSAGAYYVKLQIGSLATSQKVIIE